VGVYQFNPELAFVGELEDQPRALADWKRRELLKLAPDAMPKRVAKRLKPTRKDAKKT
jgi:hypothetical protein